MAEESKVSSLPDLANSVRSSVNNNPATAKDTSQTGAGAYDMPDLFNIVDNDTIAKAGK